MDFRKSANFVEFREIFKFGAVQKRENLVDLENPEENEYFGRKIGVDTAEKEPRQVCWTLKLASREEGAIAALLLSRKYSWRRGSLSASNSADDLSSSQLAAGLGPKCTHETLELTNESQNLS